MKFDEYDLDSWHRKWNETLALMEFKDGTRELMYIKEILSLPDKHVTFMVTNLEGNTGYRTTKLGAYPIYKHWASGYYHTTKGNYATIVRKTGKKFKVGLSTESFIIEKICTEDGFETNVPLSLFKEHPINNTFVNIYDPNKSISVLDKNFLVKHGFLYFRESMIGAVAKNKLWLDYPLFTPKLKEFFPGVKIVCQA